VRATYLSLLDSLTRPAVLQQAGAAPGEVGCTACPHRCRLLSGKRGVCGLRFCQDGQLMAPWGYTSGSAVDPLEKKPLYHVCPGSTVLSFGMLGCNLHCPFCQNWTISQTVKDDRAVAAPRQITPAQLVDAAVRAGSRWLAATYNEPLVTAEWVVAVFQAARLQGLRTCIVSNGFASPATLATLQPSLDAANIDLKCFTEKGYRGLGGSLQPVLDTIRSLWQSGVWVEATTLVVPGLNDSAAELRQMASYLAGVSLDLPWHVSAYHPDYRMSDGPPGTSVATLERAWDCGRQSGLRYVYVGNRHSPGRGEDTHCPGCDTTLVARSGFTVRRCRLGADGLCPDCHCRIAGIWD
jgi:pyruvate formate lyase activating enzyme